MIKLLEMKGFKVTINGRKIIAASDRVVSVFVGAGNNPQDNYIRIGGIDSNSYYLRWLNPHCSYVELII